MKDFLIIIIILAILILAITYIVKQRKKGIKCIGCPFAKECSKKNCNSKN